MQGKNTKEKGVVEFTLFEENNHYVAVCLTFDIVLEGDDPIVLKEEIVKAAKLHMETVKELNMSDELLNRPAPKEYWSKRGGLLPLSKKHDFSLPANYEATTYTKKHGLLTTC